MAKRKGAKTNDTAEPKVYKHKEPREAFHLPESLQQALEDYVGYVRPATSKTAVLKAALEDYLERQGFWPPHGPNHLREVRYHLRGGHS